MFRQLNDETVYSSTPHRVFVRQYWCEWPLKTALGLNSWPIQSVDSLESTSQFSLNGVIGTSSRSAQSTSDSRNVGKCCTFKQDDTIVIIYCGILTFTCKRIGALAWIYLAADAFATCAHSRLALHSGRAHFRRFENRLKSALVDSHKKHPSSSIVIELINTKFTSFMVINAFGGFVKTFRSNRFSRYGCNLFGDWFDNIVYLMISQTSQPVMKADIMVTDSAKHANVFRHMKQPLKSQLIFRKFSVVHILALVECVA